ncbi:MAG: hypothetical protein CMM86_08930 [Rhodovulum sp.]|jgi:hypothetical protein|nr:hypothetical protein [Rhodovulum sp.]
MAKTSISSAENWEATTIVMHWWSRNCFHMSMKEALIWLHSCWITLAATLFRMIPDKEIYFDNKADFGAAAAKIRLVRQADLEDGRFGCSEKQRAPRGALLLIAV